MTCTAPEIVEQTEKASAVWRNVVYLTGGGRIESEDTYPSAEAARADHEKWFLAFLPLTGRFKVVTGSETVWYEASDYWCCVQVETGWD